MALSCVIPEIFNVEKIMTLKSRSRVNQGHWKCYHSIQYIVYSFLLVFYSNFVPMTHHFFRYSTSKMLENRVRGPSRSLEMSPFDRAHDFLLTFYSNYGSISCCFWDIQCRKMSWPWNRGQRSLKVIESCTIRYIVYDFLLVFFSNFVPKTNRFF